jgi:hypothetical protein
MSLTQSCAPNYIFVIYMSDAENLVKLSTRNRVEGDCEDTDR